MSEQRPEELSYEQLVELVDRGLNRLEAPDVPLEEAVKAAQEIGVYLRLANQKLDEASRTIEVRPEAAGAGEEGA